MMRAINIASWGFWVGAGGQMAFYGMLFPGGPRILMAIVALVPWFVLFAVSFCNRPPFGPRPMRHCLTLAVGWYVGLALLGEGLCLSWYPVPTGYFPMEASRVVLWLFGGLGMAVVGRVWFVLKRLED